MDQLREDKSQKTNNLSHLKQRCSAGAIGMQYNLQQKDEFQKTKGIQGENNTLSVVVQMTKSSEWLDYDPSVINEKSFIYHIWYRSGYNI